MNSRRRIEEGLDFRAGGGRVNFKVALRTPIEILTPCDNRENGVSPPHSLIFERSNRDV
jgi:hypothetical protein